MTNSHKGNREFTRIELGKLIIFNIRNGTKTVCVSYLLRRGCCNNETPEHFADFVIW